MLYPLPAFGSTVADRKKGEPILYCSMLGRSYCSKLSRYRISLWTAIIISLEFQKGLFLVSIVIAFSCPCVCLSRMWEVLGVQSTVGGASRKVQSAICSDIRVVGGAPSFTL